jgi:murein DD-endopeptidase MepM/ murein hydrolase activator NlpD
MRLARAFLAAMSLLLATAAVADVELRARAFRDCRERVDRAMAHGSVELAPEHRDVLCEHFAEKVENRLPDEAAWRWLDGRIRDVVYAWAPLGARQKPGTTYRLPYVQWIPRLCSQGSGTETHATPEDFHAYDFLMPIGTEVLAAREGMVVQVEDGTPEGLPFEERGDGNAVLVLHNDGTFAAYAHLTPGIPVRVGQTVGRGQPLGRSGNTGFSRTPHLHFVVRARTQEGEIKAIPIRFSVPGRASFDMEVGHHHGVVPPSKRTLRLSLEGRAVEDGEKPIPFRQGAAGALRIELVERDGTVRDVTRDERTRYEPMTPWSLSVPEPGRVSASAAPGVDDSYIRRTMPKLNQGEGLLFVYYGVPKDPDFGFGRLTLAVEVPSEAAERAAPATQPPP